MRVLKEKTVAISCRVSEEMEYQIVEMADTLRLSKSQYITVLVTIGHLGEAGLKILEDKLAESYEKQQEMEKVISKLSHFTRPAFATPLAAVLQNEQILTDLYEAFKRNPILRSELLSRHFEFNVMLQAKAIEGTTYYFMGSYGWTYADPERKTVTIRKTR